MIDKRLGARIRECRERRGLTQDQLAEIVGLTRTYISRVERGVAFPRVENLIAIINALDVSADAIFCDVLPRSVEYQTTELSKELAGLPPDEQLRIM